MKCFSELKHSNKKISLQNMNSSIIINDKCKNDYYHHRCDPHTLMECHFLHRVCSERSWTGTKESDMTASYWTYTMQTIPK